MMSLTIGRRLAARAHATESLRAARHGRLLSSGGALIGWDGVWGREEDPAFHLHEPSPGLLRHLPELLEGQPRRALVPLCGMSLDVPFLASAGLHTVGVEYSRAACAKAARLWEVSQTPAVVSDHCALYASAAVPRTRAATHSAPGGQQGSVALLHADIFAVPPDCVESADVVWDRGGVTSISPQTVRQSFESLPPGIRAELPALRALEQRGLPADDDLLAAAVVYFECLRHLASAGARILVETMAAAGLDGAGGGGMDGNFVKEALSQAGWKAATELDCDDVTALYPDATTSSGAQNARLLEVRVLAANTA